MNDPDEPLNSVSKIDRISRQDFISLAEYFDFDFAHIMYQNIFDKHWNETDLLRIVFPVSFFIINIFYWNIYLGAEETTDLSRETWKEKKKDN